MSSAPVIRVKSAVRHPRLRYVLRLIGDDLGYRFRFENDRSVFGTPTATFTIAYGGDGPRTLPHHPLVSGRDPAPADTAPSFQKDGLPVFFHTDRGPDLLACIFYTISRYEEYQDFVPDGHGRYTAALSHAGRHGYLYRPVVREWTAQIARQLLAWFPELPPPRRRTLLLRPTYDIDLLWAWHHRGWRGYAALLRDLFSGEVARGVQRLRSGPENDPYNTLDRLEDLHRELGMRATYFWLVARSGCRSDTNPFPIPDDQQKLMRRLESDAENGLHPGYRSSDQPALMVEERVRLEAILGRNVNRSRQHFLRFRLPGTYRELLEAGIREDYSMGYSDDVGWRAGTNLPFTWYDLERERATPLVVHPFAAMDVTLKNYLRLSGADAGARIGQLAAAVKPFGGSFTLLWHNSSFADAYGWAGWWDNYRATLRSLLAAGAEPWSGDRKG
ncbi:polysaccharide deacetylase family protein [Neolewinella litorea]|uniref:DUF7033 domain-containing protein n=1 Tax=Neolewinella litorea TaxID=2562452 RepID=A0A4S4NMG4_9BACT|nr:polysaccharide deacetylase family protein [Neolewinella litorea]THH41104.1 hypothetical protein E4021_00475 [Neolewinella litorea]